MAIYVVQAGENGACKIGLARDVLKRVAYLQINQPATLRLLHAFDGGRAAETELHRRFAAHRQKGEWFDAAPEILAGDFGLPRLDLVADKPAGRVSGYKPRTPEAQASAREKFRQLWADPVWVAKKLHTQRRSGARQSIRMRQDKIRWFQAQRPDVAEELAQEIMTLCDVPRDMVLEPVLRDYYADIQERLGFPRPRPKYLSVLGEAA